MNKKGQFDPYTLGAIAIGILILAIVIPFFTDAIADINCQDERQELERLNNQLAVCQGSEQQANEQLANCQGQLDPLIKENEELKDRLSKLQEELNNCQKTKEYFPVFWLANVNLTDTWIIILNISLGISIVSIFNILRWMFSSNKKKRR